MSSWTMGSIAQGVAMIVAIASTASAQFGLPVRLEPTVAADPWGQVIETGGDATGDGHPDLLVYASDAIVGGGDPAHAWYLYSPGDDWAVAHEHLYRPDDRGLFYRSNATFIGDTNRDGHDEYAFAYPANSPDGTFNWHGIVRVHDGATGDLLAEFAGVEAGTHFGIDLVSPGDVNLDGVPDLAVISNYMHDGRVALYSGADWSLLYERDLGFEAARRLAPVGDIDDDGVTDLGVALQFNVSVGAASAPGVLVISGADGSPVFMLDRGTFGWTVAGGVDFTDDGVPDILAGGTRLDGVDILGLFSGADGSLVRVFGSELGGDYAELHLTDVDGDGAMEFASFDLSRPTVNVYEAPDFRMIRSFASAFRWTLGDGRTLAFADFNRDGSTDAAITNVRTEVVTLLSGGAMGLYIERDDTGFAVQFAETTPGAEETLVTVGGAPSARTAFLMSATGAECTIVPRFGQCLNLTAPIHLFASAASSPVGTTLVTVTLPSTIAPGTRWLQAAQAVGGELVVSNVLEIEVAK
ncbi:MAG: hypothetical protein ACF8PN_07340 [Phycisphaerales bacterium]